MPYAQNKTKMYAIWLLINLHPFLQHYFLNSGARSSKLFQPLHLYPKEQTQYRRQQHCHLCCPWQNAWGMHKIILGFCDDFRRDLYKLS
jgi:hypothetical protein